MLERGGSEVPFLQLYPQEQALSRERADFLAGLQVLQQVFGNFHENMVKTTQFTRALAPHRGELHDELFAWQSQVARAMYLSETLLQRATTLYHAKSLYLSVREGFEARSVRRVRKLLVSTEDPYTHMDTQIEGIGIDVWYKRESRKPEELRCAPREVVASPSGAFAFITRHNQDDNLALRRERFGRDGYLEAYVQSSQKRMPLSDSLAFERILESSAVTVRQPLREAVRPAVPRKDLLAVFSGLDALSTVALQKQPE